MQSLVFLFMISLGSCANWAILVAGSNGWSNYRHQSDIFRTYKQLINNGFNPENIITMAYDDVAHFNYNPFPGQVFNYPDGPDVYIGTDNIDYKGKNVTPEKFLAVLLGDAQRAGGKVLQSTDADNVFLFMNDHGGYGVFLFPDGLKLYSEELVEVIKSMYKRGLYKNLLIYVEACYSGSLFSNILPKNINAYAMTAANESESSYAAYCSIEKYRWTCLSNEFSQNWMQFVENNNIWDITVAEVFDHTITTTKMSHVKSYGQLTVTKALMGQFLSPKNHSSGGNRTISDHDGSHYVMPPMRSDCAKWRHLRQEDAYMKTTELVARGDPFGEAAVYFHQQREQHKLETARLTALASYFGFIYPDPNETRPIWENIDLRLYRGALEAFEEQCGRLNEHNVWAATHILSRAIGSGILDEERMGAYRMFLKTL